MSMSTHVVGFRPADEKWEQMKTIWLACTKAGIGAPEEVLDFFEHEDPIGKPGIEISIDNALKEWADDYRSGYELDVSKLPPNIRIIRFYNSY